MVTVPVNVPPGATWFPGRFVEMLVAVALFVFVTLMETDARPPNHCCTPSCTIFQAHEYKPAERHVAGRDPRAARRARTACGRSPPAPTHAPSLPAARCLL